MLASLAPSSQTVGSIIRLIHEQAKCSSRITEANIPQVVEATLQVAPNNEVQESANISAPRAATEKLQAD